MSLTVAEWQEFLHYDPESGVFTWRKKPNRCIRIGAPAGTRHHHGYIVVRLFGERQRAHRLAWFFQTGQYPTGDIDHVDGDPANNRFNNIRDVTTAQNIQNQKVAHKRNTTGLLGASPSKGGGFRARICTDGRTEVLGYYPTAEQAHEAYLAAKRQRHATCTI